MIHTIRTIPEFFHSYYDVSEVYSQPQIVDLDKEIDTYSFTLHHPGEEDAINQLFDLHVAHQSGEVVTLDLLLGSDVYKEGDGEAFEKMGFRQLNPNPAVGIVLEHDLLNGWLIKKNYGWMVDDDGEKKRITKGVGAKDIPRWMLPPSLRNKPKESVLGIQVPNDAINPLRVVMLKRGRKWIKSLHLNNLKAAKEYLYPLSASKPENPKPLHERTVVISKKEELLDEGANLWHFAELAQSNPSKLKEIALQICLFITCNPLTDLHLNNVRFMDDGSDRLFFMDGEPIGGLAEASDPLIVDANQKYDRGFFSILGLRKLQLSISEDMEDEGLPDSDIKNVQKIFDEAIDMRVRVIDWERKWHWIKVCISVAADLILSLFTKLLAILLSGQAPFSPSEASIKVPN